MLSNRNLTDIEEQSFGFKAKIHDQTNVEFGKRIGIILLHGRAGDETLMWVFSRVIQDLDPVVIAPRAILDDPIGGYSWWNVFPDKEKVASTSPSFATLDCMYPGVKLIEDFARQMPVLYGVDPDKIFVVGFSQGGALAITTALKNPNLFCGVGMIASFVPKSIQEQFKNINLNKLDIFMSHGTKDEIINIEKANISANFLISINGNLEYSTDEVGHKISSSSLKAFKEWFSSKANKEYA